MLPLPAPLPQPKPIPSPCFIVATALLLQSQCPCSTGAKFCSHRHGGALHWHGHWHDDVRPAVKALFRRAKAHEGAGRQEQAVADLKQLVALDPANKPASELLKELQ